MKNVVVKNDIMQKQKSVFQNSEIESIKLLIIIKPVLPLEVSDG
jgi:hypothetical protein